MNTEYDIDGDGSVRDTVTPPPPPSPHAPPRRWRWSANVLLIGTSQSGKSTFINRFRSLAVGPHPLPDPALIGKGTSSCTRDPFVYEYDIPMTDFVVVDRRSAGQVEVPEDEKSIFDHHFWKRNDLIVQRRNPGADLARIRLIDTPGLDDSDPQLNAVNIQKVLQCLNQQSESDTLDHRHLSAVVFVIKAQAPFHASLQTWYHYYKRCMPNLFGSIAVVNSNFRLRDWKAEYTKKAINVVSLGTAKLSSREKRMKERREAWAKTFGNDPTHFFIDSKPVRSSPFEEYISANIIHDIMLYLRSQGRLPIENIRLAKLTEMVGIDGRLAARLQEICYVWESEREMLLKSVSTTHQSLAQHEKNIVLWQTEIEELEKKIEGLDTDVQYDLNTYQPTIVISTGSKFTKFFTFSGHGNTFSITEAVFPFEVSAPDTDTTVWQSRNKATAQDKTWTGQYKSKWCKTPKFSNRSYTTNRTFYEAQIKEARRRIMDVEERLVETMEICAKQKDLILNAGSSASEHSPKLLQLAEWIARAEKLMRHLREGDVPLQEGFNPAAMRRYAKEINKIGYDEVLDYITVAEPGMRAAAEVATTQLKDAE